MICSSSLHVSGSGTRNSPSPPSSEASDEPVRKIKASPQLNRWSRARTIRSGRKLDRSTSTESLLTKSGSLPVRSQPEIESLLLPMSPPNNKRDSRSSSSDDEKEGNGGGIPIFILSDGTGWTAEHAVNAALGQFDYCLIDGVCPVNTHLFSGVSFCIYSYPLMILTLYLDGCYPFIVTTNVMFVLIWVIKFHCYVMTKFLILLLINLIAPFIF